MSPTLSATATSNAPPAWEAIPLPSAVTSTFSKRPLRCTLKVIPPSRVYESEQPEESQRNRAPEPRGARRFKNDPG